MSLFNLIPSLVQNHATSTQACSTQPNSEQLPTLRPQYQVQETAEAWALTVQLPGIAREQLEFTVDEAQVRVAGKRQWKQPADWSTLYRESSDTGFELVLNHENAIDADKIHAELKDGILRATLPKAAAIKPRKIAVS
jgi:HSP20 family molecular chaperone IbpA